jgi:hypothetical protein
MSKVNLRDVLKNSYADRNKQKNALSKNGFIYDEALSNDNSQTYYNPKENKILYSVTGTHNLKDWGTDLYLATGHLKDTNRYKDADKKLKEAKAKYGGSTTTVVGHSLGGSIAGYISSKGDDVFTLDKGATVGQPVRNNERAFRSSGDIVSLLNANSKHMTTLKNPNFRTHVMSIDIVKAHDINNISNAGITV